MKTFAPKLFEKQNSYQWKQYLDENGFVVLRNILSKEKMIQYFKLFAKDWKYVSPNFNFIKKYDNIPTEIYNLI